MGGESKRRRAAREAAGIPEDGFKVRICDPARVQRIKEKTAVAGVMIPVPSSNRKERRMNPWRSDLPIQRPLTADQIEQLHGPCRRENEKVRATDPAKEA
jgi:hypothetical protein